MLSAWAQHNNLVLGQIKVDNKSNEITTIPKLLSRLNIAGSVITKDSNRTRKNRSIGIMIICFELFEQFKPGYPTRPCYRFNPPML